MIILANRITVFKSKWSCSLNNSKRKKTNILQKKKVRMFFWAASFQNDAISSHFPRINEFKRRSLMNTCQATASKEKCRQKSKSKSYTILWCLQGNVLWRLVVFVRKFTYLEWTKKQKNDQIRTQTESDLIKKPKDVKWKDLNICFQQ